MTEVRFPMIGDLYQYSNLTEEEICLFQNYASERMIDPSNYESEESSLLGEHIKTVLEMDYKYNRLSPELKKLFEEGVSEAIWDFKLWHYLIANNRQEN